MPEPQWKPIKSAVSLKTIVANRTKAVVPLVRPPVKETIPFEKRMPSNVLRVFNVHVLCILSLDN